MVLLPDMQLPGLRLDQLAGPPRRSFDAGAFDGLREHAFYQLAMNIRHRYRPGSAPPCRRPRLLSQPHPSSIGVEVAVYDGTTCRIQLPLPPGVDERFLTLVGFEAICALYWDGEAELFNRYPHQRFDWRDHVELRNRIEGARRGLRPRPTMPEGYRTLGFDLGTEERTATSYRTGANSSYAVLDDVEALTPSMAERIEREHAYLMRAEMMQRPDWSGANTLGQRAYADANARGEKLLREWLSPEQLAEYQRYGAFMVTGNATRKRYRIQHGRVQNVFELDGDGREICGWCFAPTGNLVAGDVMLAQKVALETNERAALKVANRFRDASHGWIDEVTQFDVRPAAINRVLRGPQRPRPGVVPGQIVVDSRSWTGRD